MAKLKKSIINLKNRFIRNTDHLEQKNSKGKEVKQNQQNLNSNNNNQHQLQDNFENLRYKNFILPSYHSVQDTKVFFQNAIIHGLATRVGDENYQEDQEKLQQKLDKWNSGLSVQDLPDYCLCCGLQVQKQSIEVFNSDTLDLDFLGPGIPLYFGFLKYTALFLCTLILCIGSFNFFSNGFLNGCTNEGDEKNGCNKNLISMFSLPNKRFDKKFNQLQEILDVFTIGALVIMLQFFRKNQNQIAFQADNLDLSESDYAIKIHGLPKYENALTKNRTYTELKRGFQPYLEGDTFYIDQVNFCYNLDKLNKLKEELEILIKEYKSALKSFYSQQNESQTNKKMENEDTYIKKIDLKEQEIHQLQNMYLINMQNYDLEDPSITQQFTGVCYVVFKKEAHKVKVLQQKKQIIKNLFEGQHNITFEEGPDPTDVKWENQGVKGTKKQYIGYLKSISIEFAVLAIGFLCVWFCSQFVLKWQIEQDPSLSNICNETSPEAERLGRQQEIQISSQHLEGYIDHDHSQHDQISHLLGQNQDYASHQDYVTDKRVTYMTYFITFLLIPAFNSISRMTMQYTTKYEQHETVTRMNIAKSRKLALSMFFTMGLQTLLIKVVLKWMKGCLFAGRQEIFQDGGLIYTQINLFISNAIFYPILYYIDVAYIFKVLKRYWYADRNQSQCTLTQKEANDLYQRPEYDIAQRYGYLINVMFLTALYAPLLPISILISLFGVIFVYWIEKYNILRKSVIFHKIGYNLSTQMTELLEYFLPLYCLADMFFQYVVVITAHRLPESQSNPIVDMFIYSSFTAQIGVIIGLLNLMLPMQKINQWIFTSPPQLENKHHYEEAKEQFNNTYRGLNPITGHVAKNELIQKDRLA